jgi:DNA-binding SARP family transcriptional activator/WD40 repeat protein
MAIWLLGPLRVDGVERLAPRDRVVLSVLALEAGHVVSFERLADALWGERVPDSWAKVLQGSVVRLRKILGRSAVETTSGGYRLTVPADEIDLRRFEGLVDKGRALARQGEHERAAMALADAVELWRGPALADVEQWDEGRAHLARLEERLRAAEELLVEERLAAGHDVVAAARALADAAPLRERRWQLLATALYRDSRQGEALAALRAARTVLRDELGLDPGPELLALERAVLQRDPGLRAPGRRTATSTHCPYRGLRVFEREDADGYFGRDQEVQNCLRVLRESPVLAVVGSSGSGKSSLVRAGLIPLLESPGRAVPIVVPGTDPIAALVSAASAAGRAPALVVDQLEELFTAGHELPVVRGFLERLAALARGGDRIVVVVRADHLGGLALAPAFARLAEQGLLLLAEMSEEALRDAVLGPARQAGLRLEPGLVELLLRDVEDEPGALPLLSHALAETWERREADLLTVDGYRATGGIRHAVARSAELLHEQLDASERLVLRSLVMRLVALTPDGVPSAVRVPVATLTADPERRRILDLLVRARLVTTDDRTVVLAHEALISAWPRLRAWLDQDVAGARVARHLALAAEDWETGGRADSDLYRGGRLAAAVELEPGAVLTPLEQAFLTASSELAAAERQAADERRRHEVRQHRRVRRALAATAAGLVVAVTAGAVAVDRSLTASANARAAQDDRLIAQVDRLVAQSAVLLPTRRDLAALLAVEAYRLRSDASTRSALFGVLTEDPGFSGYASTGTGDDAVPVAAAEALDDDTLVAVAANGVVRLISLDGEEATTFSPPSEASDGAVVALSADGRTAAAVSWNLGLADRPVGRSRLVVYDVATGRPRLPEAVVPMDVRSVAVSADGAHVAVGGYEDGRALVYGVTGRTSLADLVSVSAPVPNGVRVLPPGGPATPDSNARHTAAVAFDDAGKLLVGSTAGSIRVVDPRTGRVVRILDGAGDGTSNLSLNVSGGDQVLLSAGAAGLVRWNVSRGRPSWTATTGPDACGLLAVHRQGGVVLCGRLSGGVTAFDLETGRRREARYDMQRGPLSALLVTPNGQSLVQASAVEPVSARWRLDGTGPVTTRIPLPGAAGPFSPDGRHLLVEDDYNWTLGRADATPVVVDASTGAVVTKLDGYWAAMWVPSSHGRVAAWGGPLRGDVVDLASGRVERQLGTTMGPPHGYAAAAAAPRALLWGFGEEASYAVVDLTSGDQLWIAGAIGLEGGALTPDGRTAVRLDDDRVLSADVDARTLLAEAPALQAVAISPAGGMVGASAAGLLMRYDPRTLKAIGGPLDVTRGEVSELVFDGSGELLAVRRPNGTVTLVDMDSGTELGQPVPGHAVHLGGGHVSLRSDGELLSVPVDGGTSMWQLSPDIWVAQACRLAGRELTETERQRHLNGQVVKSCSSAGAS